jgi:nucleoside-diphosphate-sugar epimerase
VTRQRDANQNNASIDDLLETTEFFETTRPSTVINCITRYPKNGCADKEIEYSNFTLGKNIFNQIVKSGIKTQFVTINTTLHRKTNQYAASKDRLQKYIKHQKPSKIVTKDVRLEYFYSPNESKDKFISKQKQLLILSRPIYLDTPLQLRSINHVNDVVEGLNRIINHNTGKQFSQYHIGNQKMWSVLEIVRMLRYKLQSSSLIKMGDEPYHQTIKARPNVITTQQLGQQFSQSLEHIIEGFIH